MRPLTIEWPLTTEWRYNSPFGQLRLIEADGNIVICDWVNSARHDANLKRITSTYGLPIFMATPLLVLTAGMLDEYFAFKREKFTIPIKPVATEFEQTVWDAISEIEYGSTASYSYIAEKIGQPKAVRAVAAAIGRNPLSIIIPCHRIIGSDGSIGGYAGGRDAKNGLLSIEYLKRL